MKLNATLIGLTAGATLALAPQLAQAQFIQITSGSYTVGATVATRTYVINTPQGSATLTGLPAVNPVGENCTVCAQEVADLVSGTGFSPSGPVVFSGVPIVVNLTSASALNTTSTINNGFFNRPQFINANPQATIDNFFTAQGVTAPLTSPDFSSGNFSFDTAFPTTVVVVIAR